MSTEENKMTGHAGCNVMRFVRNDCDHLVEDHTDLQVVDSNADEIEFAFNSGKDRVYLRVRNADLARLIREARQ